MELWLRRLTLPPIMNFFDRTLRDWKLTLLPIAAAKPGQLKVTCVVEYKPAVPQDHRVIRVWTLSSVVLAAAQHQLLSAL